MHPRLKAPGIRESAFDLLPLATTMALLIMAAAAHAQELLYVSTQARTTNGLNAVETFTTNGVGSLFAVTASINPRGVAFDTAGNLFVASALWNTIEKFTPDGNGSVFARATNGLHGPFGLAF